jgi:hypothetical protein
MRLRFNGSLDVDETIIAEISEFRIKGDKIKFKYNNYEYTLLTQSYDELMTIQQQLLVNGVADVTKLLFSTEIFA